MNIKEGIKCWDMIVIWIDKEEIKKEVKILK